MSQQEINRKEKKMKMEFSNKLKIIWGLILGIFLCPFCFAAGPVSPFVHSIDGVVMINISAVRACYQTFEGTKYSYFPSEMRPVESSDLVFQELINYNLKNFLNQKHMKGLKQQSENLSEAVAINHSQDEGHNFSFKVDVLRNDTVLAYSGIVEARLSYQFVRKSINLEVLKSLDEKLDVVFTHLNDEVIRSDLLALRYSF